MATVRKSSVFADLPPVWEHALLPEIRAHLIENPHMLVVLDDDPTGTQTVHDVPVLTTWDVDALRAEFGQSSGAFYILTNSRSLPAAEAEALTIAIARNLKRAAGDTPFRLVSRSDSTLRGHFPLELRALSDALDRTFDGWLVVPFFEEGGRFTIDSVHYVAEDGELIPAAQTPFAKDASFGYATSTLTEWVEEKTGGAVKAADVAAITIDTLRSGPDAVLNALMALRDEQVCVIDAACYRDIEVLVLAILRAEAAGKSFLYRTAASFVRARAGLDALPLLDADSLVRESGGAGGLVIVGSYVPKTTEQLTYLLDTTAAIPVELDVDRLLSDEREAHIQQTVTQIDAHLRDGSIPVLYTSRGLVTGKDAPENLRIGKRVADALVSVVRGLTQRPAFIVAKGGITSSEIATRGLDVRRAIVRGQIAPGIPVWELDSASRYPDLPYIVFPGNVGARATLATVVQQLMVSAERSANAQANA